tara:strand:+ start:131 stop:811 length:681 start_codon:yes stop_codon:yes gene_type:complete
MKRDITIIGINDSLAGQVINFLPKNIRNRINCIIYDKNQKKKKNSLINKKIETIDKDTIFGFKYFRVSSYTKFLKDNKIKKVFLLIDSNKERKKIFSSIKSQVKVLSFVHPKVYLSGKNIIGEGSILFPGSYLGYKSNVGMLTVIQSNCKIEHHNEIGNFCDINPNLTTGGFTQIEDNCTINMSVNISNRIKISANCHVGAGSLVLKDTFKGYLYYGVPAKKIRKV